MSLELLVRDGSGNLARNANLADSIGDQEFSACVEDLIINADA